MHEQWNTWQVRHRRPSRYDDLDHIELPTGEPASGRRGAGGKCRARTAVKDADPLQLRCCERAVVRHNNDRAKGLPPPRPQLGRDVIRRDAGCGELITTRHAILSSQQLVQLSSTTAGR